MIPSRLHISDERFNFHRCDFQLNLKIHYMTELHMFGLVFHSNVNNKAINEQFQGSKPKTQLNSFKFLLCCTRFSPSSSLARSIFIYISTIIRQIA